MNKIIGLKELRENVEKYVSEVNKGNSFTVIRRSKPIFKIAPVDDDSKWENVIDFTKLKKGGIRAEELLKYL